MYVEIQKGDGIPCRIVPFVRLRPSWATHTLPTPTPDRERPGSGTLAQPFSTIQLVPVGLLHVHDGRLIPCMGDNHDIPHGVTLHCTRPVWRAAAARPAPCWPASASSSHGCAGRGCSATVWQTHAAEAHSQIGSTRVERARVYTPELLLVLRRNLREQTPRHLQLHLAQFCHSSFFNTVFVASFFSSFVPLATLCSSNTPQ